jgi:hypothetical protein
MLDMGDKITKCSVREGRFVDPCDTLASMVEIQAAGFSRGKGIARWAYTNTQTLEPSRTFFGVKTKERPNGMLFNVCPWCGERIDAAFASNDDAGETPSGTDDGGEGK